MKRRLISRLALSVVCSSLLIVTPLGVRADDVALQVESGDLSPVVITEVQTGNVARADEFVELYNTTDDPIDLTGWQLRYVTASATSIKNVEDPSVVVPLVPPLAGDTAALVPGHGYYLLYSGAVVLPTGVLGQQYEGMLPATGGSLILVSPDNDACEFVAEDALAWGGTTHLFGEGEALVHGSTSSVDRLFQRYVDPSADYVDTANSAHDFAAASAAALPTIASPGVANGQLLPGVPIPGSGVQSQAFALRFSNLDCTIPPDPVPPVDPPAPPDESPPSTTEPAATEPDDNDASQPTIPQANIGLKAPMLSEFLPNPASPQTDKDDEFIELYNPNDTYFELSGYVLEVGVQTKRRYTIATGVKIAPRAFMAVFSSESGLALSNSGSQVALVDPLGRTLVVSDPYATAKDGQAWVFANGLWQWTTKPTPNASNVVSLPATGKTTAKKAKNTISTASSKKTGVAGQSTGTNPEEDAAQIATVASTTSTPLHPGVLALVAVSALLYGAYEYRGDVANKIYQFRSNRAARRALRQSAQGR